MGAALYLDLRHRAGARVAAVALALLATTPFFFIGGQYANHDMLVAGCITLAIVCAGVPWMPTRAPRCAGRWRPGVRRPARCWPRG